MSAARRRHSGMGRRSIRRELGGCFLLPLGAGRRAVTSKPHGNRHMQTGIGERAPLKGLACIHLVAVHLTPCQVDA